MGDKVAILGTVPNSRDRFNYDDLSWDIWCCSGGNSQTNAPKRITEWFELHALVDLHSPEHNSWYHPYIAWLNTQQFPVWMQERNDDIPRAQVFPRKKLTERFGPNKQGKANWFTSSPAWMFGYALERGYKTIGVFGIDMAAAQEHYTGQKAGFHRWFEIAREMGVKVIVPLESSLAFTYPQYGYAEASRLGRHLVAREMETQNRLNFLRNQHAILSRDIAHLEGSFEQLVFERRTYTSSLEDVEIDESVGELAEMGISQFSKDLLSRAADGETRAMDTFVPSENSSELLVPSSSQRPLASRVPKMSDFPNNPDAELLALRRSNGAAP